jgi:tRNA pseudouridine38-40 synthase
VPRYALNFEYDGLAFSGTQEQRDGLRTLQSVLMTALTLLDREQPAALDAPLKVRLASRLDAGVSARGLVGDVLLPRPWSALALGMALSSHLPADVVVRKVAEVPDNWNAKTSAKSKTYVYCIRRRNIRPVLDRRCWWVRRIDFPEHLPTLATFILGDQDLSGFSCLRRDESDLEDPHRRVLHAQWDSELNNGEEVYTFTITGEGFLYKQIRGLVGAMLFVAQGRATIDDFRSTIKGGREAARIGNIAPAEGLTLLNITYDPAPTWITI